MPPRSKVVAAVVAVVALIPVGVFLARQNINLDLGFQADPLEYVEVVDKARPNGADLRAVLERLDNSTEVTWRPGIYQDWDAERGQRYDGNRKAQASLSRSVTLPDAADFGVTGVVANTEDARAVARHGALYLIWFDTPADAENWLVSDPPVFADASLEERRTSYWAGKFAVYYAPPTEGRDWSPEMRRFVEELAECPGHARQCEVPEG